MQADVNFLPSPALWVIIAILVLGSAVDIRYWNEPERGGHFAAFERPKLFVDEVSAFFRLVR